MPPDDVKDAMSDGIRSWLEVLVSLFAEEGLRKTSSSGTGCSSLAHAVVDKIHKRGVEAASVTTATAALDHVGRLLNRTGGTYAEQ